jgi:hypothetical protein
MTNCSDFWPAMLFLAVVIGFPVAAFVGVWAEAGGTPFTELGRATLSRRRDFRSRKATYLRAGLDAHSAENAAETDMHREAAAILREIGT